MSVCLCGLAAALAVSTGPARADDDGPLAGFVDWMTNVNREYLSEYDKTDFWAAIAYSPATGKFGCSGNWIGRDTATRAAKDNCNADDARPVVVVGNGWCALALGKDKSAWGVGWGPDRATAEQNALEAGRQRTSGCRVVFSINAREIKQHGAIAYSRSTGEWGWATGGPRTARSLALKNCKSDDEVVVCKYDCWLALALSDDKGVYAYASAGNKIDAERNALEACRKRAANCRIAVSFCSNGREPAE